MTYRVVRRAYTHFTDYGSRKPNVGGFLHNTVTAIAVTTFQSAGGWNYQIDRDGTRYVDVPETLGAWHVQACGAGAESAAVTRWRPPWLLRAPGGLTSDPNYCTLGIELVSLAGATGEPAGYVAYTDDQYASLAELLEEIKADHGPIPWLGHGQVQTNRTDPVRFDWERAGFGPMLPNWGRLWLGTAPAPDPDEELAMDTTPEERAAMKSAFERLNVPVNMETALMKRAALAFKREEWRGPAVGGEYPDVADDGSSVVRQRFSAGILEYKPATGETFWVEVVAHPETIA